MVSVPEVKGTVEPQLTNLPEASYFQFEKFSLDSEIHFECMEKSIIQLSRSSKKGKHY